MGFWSWGWKESSDLEAAGYKAKGSGLGATVSSPAISTALPLLTALFSVHTFLLMGTGTWSDLAMAGEDFGSALYYTREAVLAAGFLAYAAFAQWRAAHPLSQKAADIAGLALVVLFAGCILALQLANPPVVRVSAVLVAALIVGASGALVYERIALSVAEDSLERGASNARNGFRALGIIIGAGGALAVALQYVLQIWLALGWVLTACFIICFALLVWLARGTQVLPSESETASDGDAASLHSARDSRSPHTATPVCLVVAVACLFALFPFYEAAMRSTGAVASFYEWHRLFLAAGYTVIGIAAYLGGRPAASAAILVCALFALIVSVQTDKLDTSPLTAALFYALLGATLAWSGISFMSIAAQHAHPALVASAWRMIAALVTLAGSLIQAAGELPLMTVLACSLALLAALVLAMVRGGFLVFSGQAAQESAAPREEPAPTPEERMQMLARECSLTNREQEVLAALVLTEDKNQQIADELGISRRQLQTYVSRIYKKTNTTTRAGLVMRMKGES